MGVLDTFKGLRQRERGIPEIVGNFFGLGLIEVGGEVCGLLWVRRERDSSRFD